ncbi:MAG: FadR family transcriptional regulator [Anaerotruncus sp.]|nr:FadR family transcriptional regulator [Anaerotruncus sp.]
MNEVYRQIREMILSKSWNEGEKIASENKLAAQFSVSRVVIREALQRLRSERLIVTRQGMGSFVSNPQNYAVPDASIALTEQAFISLMEFRQSVEYSAIELSAKYATEEDFDRLRNALQGMRDTADDIVQFSNNDFDFHYAVVCCSHNEFLKRSMLCNRELMVSILMEMNSVPASYGFGLDMHEEITKSLCRRDVKHTLKLYQRQTEYNLTRLADFFK